MTKFDENHFILDINAEVQRICQPLFERLDLSYFNYSRVYPDGSIFGLLSSRQYAQLVCDNMHRAKILSPKPQTEAHPETIISLWSERAELWVMQALTDLGMYHPIMFSEVREGFTENFVFASKHNRSSSIENYFNNLMMLQRFRDYFRSVADKLIQKASDPKNRLFLTDKSHPFSLDNFIEPFDPDQKEMIELHIGQERISLTIKQKQCLDYLAQGLSAKEIALRMNISPRTVEAHLNHVKMKLNVNFKSELLKLWGQAFYL